MDRDPGVHPISQVSAAPNGLCWITERKVLVGSRPAAEKGNHSSSHAPTTELVQSSCAQHGSPSQAAGCTQSPVLQSSACSRLCSWAACWGAQSTGVEDRGPTGWCRRQGGTPLVWFGDIGLWDSSLAALRLIIIILKGSLKVNEKMLDVLSSEQVSQNVNVPLSPSPCSSCPHRFNSASFD